MKLVGFELLIDFRLKETLGTADPHLLHVDLCQAGQLLQTTVRGQFPVVRLAEDQQELTERYFAVLVLVHLGDHFLQAEMRLGRSQFLHHDLQLGQIQETILADVVSVAREKKTPTNDAFIV